MSYASVVASDSPTWWWRCSESGGYIAQSYGTGQASAFVPGWYGLNTQPFVAGGLGYTGIANDGGSYFVAARSGVAAELDNATIPVGFGMEAWVCAPTGNNGYFDRAGGGSAGFLLLTESGIPVLSFFGSGHTLVATATIGNSAPYSCGGAVPLNDGFFHHLAATVTNTGAQFYVDGVSSFPNTGTFPGLSAHGWQLAIPSLSSNSSVAVCEVAIYTGGLSSTRVAAHYAARERHTRPTWRNGLAGLCT